MSHIAIEDFDRYLSLSERDAHDAAVASNDAFVEAMTREIGRGRVKAVAGTYVDTSPPVGAKRLRGILPMSACGSPGAMCMEASVPQIGSVALMK
jgi:hypothetical protein